LRSEYGFARGLRRALAGFAVLALAASPLQAQSADKSADKSAAVTPARVTIDLGPAGVLRSFRPDEAIGAAFDGAMKGDIDRQMTPANIKAMKSANLRPLSYRLRTELGVEAWHWNPVGTWSDPKRQQGYWTSSAELGQPIQLSWGYRLPRRGDTEDNANDSDYSRLDDGDPKTFWKSNPYLDPDVIKDGEAHPQYLLMRFDKPRAINAAIIDWATPYATRYRVQYWTSFRKIDPKARWVTFAEGQVDQGKGGRVVLNFGGEPVLTKYVRVLMLTSSHTAPAGSTDWRDRMGYAVREASFGLRGPDGQFTDWVQHHPSHKTQTFSHVSSTDPWHRAVDKDDQAEQPGIDRLFASGLGFGLPIMLPTGLLYDTPENIEAELRYVARRKYPVRQIELGEEADGQYAFAADYAALFAQTVDRMKGVVPGAVFGGPSAQAAYTGTLMQPEHPGRWTYWFVDYLKRHGRLNDLGFYSFEFYVFDNLCGDLHPKLIEQGDKLALYAHDIGADGVPRTIPWVISEYGWSAFSGRAMSEISSAELMSNIVGQWLTLGGSAAYMFGYPPGSAINQLNKCAGYGDMMLFLDDNGKPGQPLPIYHTAKLLTERWTVPGHGPHQLLATTVEGAGRAVAAYTVRQPDGKIGVLLINRGARKTYRLSLAGLSGPGEVDLYGAAQYAWKDIGERSRPVKDEPPEHRTLPAGPLTLDLPPDTIAVVIALK
jgi:hypothetical protein